MRNLDKTKTISFSIPNVHIIGEDSLDIRKKILDITPEDRKKLGINKSTLWYQKRNLARVKAIRVYGKMLNRLRSRSEWECEGIKIKALAMT